MLADGLRADLELIAGQLFFLIADGLRADLEFIAVECVLLANGLRADLAVHVIADGDYLAG